MTTISAGQPEDGSPKVSLATIFVPSGLIDRIGNRAGVAVADKAPISPAQIIVDKFASYLLTASSTLSIRRVKYDIKRETEALGQSELPRAD